MKTIEFSSDDALWDQIHEWNKKDYIMVISCLESTMGLTAGHAYTVLGSYILDNQKVI